MREGLSKSHGLPVGPLTGIHIRASPHPVSSVRTYPFTNHPGPSRSAEQCDHRGPVVGAVHGFGDQRRSAEGKADGENVGEMKRCGQQDEAGGDREMPEEPPKSRMPGLLGSLHARYGGAATRTSQFVYR
jgi:hypothetical protein